MEIAMLLERQERLIAITASSLLFASSLSADTTTIQGDCNVISPAGIISGDVTYEIICNNISASASDQIKRILEIIEDISKESAGSDFSEALALLMRNSEAAIAELRKTRSPQIVLSQRSFDICDSCYTDIHFINEGGEIRLIDQFLVREIIAVQARSGSVLTSRGRFDCPFREFSPFESNWITMDYSSGGYSVSTEENLQEGATLAWMEFSNRYRGQERFLQEIYENYNSQRQIRLGNQVDLEVLDLCVEHEFNLGVKLALRNYGGAAYEQYFVFEYEREFSEMHLRDKPFSDGSAGFNSILAEYDKAKAARQFPNGGGETVNFSVIAKFLLDNSLP